MRYNVTRRKAGCECVLTAALQLYLKAEYTFIHRKEPGKKMLTVVLSGWRHYEACFLSFCFLHFLLMGLYHLYKAPLCQKNVLINCALTII